jgi:hypothetical protein
MEHTGKLGGWGGEFVGRGRGWKVSEQDKLPSSSKMGIHRTSTPMRQQKRAGGQSRPHHFCGLDIQPREASTGEWQVTNAPECPIQ